MSFNGKRCALTSALLLALSSAPAALYAQDSADAATAAEKAADAGDSTRLDTITVTAQSRSQELQDVPIALTVVTEEQIENLAATDLADIALYVPGLVVDSFDHTQPAFTLRGISTEGFSMGIDRAIGVYVNGVYQTNGGGALLAFNDVARIEVLKGPQGTLFGRNTAAGAISIITNEPTPDFEANARVRIGNDGKRLADGLLNVGLNDEFGVRLSFLDDRSDGWEEDAGTGRHYNLDRQFGTRLSIGGNVNETWKVNLSWDHEKIREPQRLQIGVLPGLSNSTARAPFPPVRSTFLDPRDVPVYNDVYGGRQTKDYDGATLAVTGSYDWGTFTSTTAFTEADLAHFEDQDGTNNPFLHLDSAVTQSGKTVYQEFKLAGANEHIDWVAGTSYYRERGRQSNIVNSSTSAIDTLLFNQGVRQPCGGPLACIDASLRPFQLIQHFLDNPYSEQIDNKMTSESYAFFGDVIWHINDRLNLTGGLRYTQDDKSFAWFNRPRSAAQLDAFIEQLRPLGIINSIPAQLLFVLQHNIVFPQAVGIEVERDGSWSDLSPRLVLDYQFTDDTMGFVSASKGYKAGGNDGVQIDSEYDPEEVRNYELGIKHVFPDLHMLLNASIYHYEYTDRQSLQLVPATNPAGIPQYLVQSTDQEADGVDFEWLWKANEHLTLNFSGAYIDSQYGSGAQTASGIDLSGQPTGEPEWSFAAGATYGWTLGSGAQMEVNVQHAYRGEQRCNDDSLFQGSCGSYTGFEVGEEQHTTNLRLGWTSPDSRWGAAFYVNNLFDEQYVRSIGGQGLSALGTPIGTITPPRQFGVEGSVRF
jgi:iron complex outermembrane receptor protein